MEDKQQIMVSRTRLPVPQPEKVNLNLWSYLKQCIGRELSKITMPVHWNEPLSLLQRITEYMNYSHLLRYLEYIAKFTHYFLHLTGRHPPCQTPC